MKHNRSGSFNERVVCFLSRCLTSTEVTYVMLETGLVVYGSVLLNVQRDRTDYQGRGAQDGHVDFHTAPEL